MISLVHIKFMTETNEYPEAMKIQPGAEFANRLPS